MKLLVFGASNTRGGVSSYLLGISDILKNENIIFDYIMENDFSIYEEDIICNGGRIFYLSANNLFTRIFKCLKIIFFNKGKYDFFYYNASTPFFIFPLLFAWMFGYKTISHSHSNNGRKFFLSNFFLRINSFIIDKISSIKLAVSFDAGKWLYGKNSNYNVLNNGINSDKFYFDSELRNKIRNDLKFKSNDIILVNVSRIDYPKNQKFLIDIMTKLSDNYKLFLIGDGKDFNYLKKYSESLNLDNVIFLGDIDNVNDYLCASDLFLLPSFYEGFCISLIEALFTGLPCVINDVLVKNFQYPVQISINNIDEWVNYIKNFKINKKRDIILDYKYTVNFVAGEFLKIIKSLDNRLINEDLISVVVPIYNIEDYVGECIDSLINQSYQNYEVILIDDGSTDNSSKIAKGYAKKYNFIKYYKKKNGGLSDARNYGIKKCLGKYITFVDGDDTVRDDYLLVLYNTLILNGADISIIDYSTFDLFNNTEYKCKIYNGKDAIKCSLIFKPFTYCTWGKLYKIELFDDVLFPFGKISEDFGTTYKLFNKCEKIVYSDIKLYYYRQRSNSIMGVRFNNNNLDAFEFGLGIHRFFINDNDILRYVRIRLCDEGTSFIRHANSLELKNYVRNTLKDYYIGPLFDIKTSLWIKIKIILYIVLKK